MLLSVNNLRVSYGNIKALHGINFHIDAQTVPVKAQPCALFPA